MKDLVIDGNFMIGSLVNLTTGKRDIFIVELEKELGFSMDENVDNEHTRVGLLESNKKDLKIKQYFKDLMQSKGYNLELYFHENSTNTILLFCTNGDQKVTVRLYVAHTLKHEVKFQAEGLKLYMDGKGDKYGIYSIDENINDLNATIKELEEEFNDDDDCKKCAAYKECVAYEALKQQSKQSVKS